MIGHDSRLGGVSRATGIALILWGVAGGSAVIWAALYLRHVDSALFALFVLVVVVPVIGLSCYSYRLYTRTRENVERYATEMGDLFNSTLSTLALAIDAKDKHTHGHTQRVQKYARAIAEAMRLGKDHIEGIATAALLHDIGKLAIPEYILNKRDTLTPEEMRKMRMHPQLGADIISNIKFPYPVTDSVLAHHERFDGEGYPNGLAGENIPLGARVLAVADAFDGYLSNHRETQETIDAAIRFVRDGAGTSFDPDVVAVWNSIYRDIALWPSTAASAAHTGIQQAKSELKILESLGQEIEGLTSVNEIFLVVRARTMKYISDSMVAIERGEREGIPIVFGGKLLATICVDRREPPLSEDELRLIHAAAAKIAPAVSNAMAIEEARREATLDKLTGLPNRRAFELMSASLQRQHFSIVLIDINSFKAVNDNFGHNAGDATLIRLAAHLRAAFHDAQLACRLGGDEFLVLSFASARSIRMQIRRFRQMVVWDPAHDAYRTKMFGVSCGLASIPLDAKNIEEAMQCADQRMYAIKARFKEFARRLSPRIAESKSKSQSGRENARSPMAVRR